MELPGWRENLSGRGRSRTCPATPRNTSISWASSASPSSWSGWARPGTRYLDRRRRAPSPRRRMKARRSRLARRVWTRPCRAAHGSRRPTVRQRLSRSHGMTGMKVEATPTCQSLDHDLAHGRRGQKVILARPVSGTTRMPYHLLAEGLPVVSRLWRAMSNGRVEPARALPPSGSPTATSPPMNAPHVKSSSPEIPRAPATSRKKSTTIGITRNNRQVDSYHVLARLPQLARGRSALQPG